MLGRQDTQHNDIHHNDTQHNIKKTTLSIMVFGLNTEMLSVTNKLIMLSVVMQNVLMLSVTTPLLGIS
jgi:hypothetical protein